MLHSLFPGNSLLAVASFDFETKSNYTIRVRTTDQGGLYFEKNLPIAIIDQPETLYATPTTGLRPV